MNFVIAQEIDWKAEKSTRALQCFIDKLVVKINEREYGSGIEHIYIGFICIKLPTGYEEWYKERKPIFRKVQKLTLLNGQQEELKNVFSYDIKLSDTEFDVFISSEKDGIELFFNKLITSLSHFDSPSMKKRKFNSNAFKDDMQRFIGEVQNA
ncbi:hypothetical protein [Glaciecola sp. KUL10]|uniref:hypothetical protein n=1 Tax=Glaciecola sp. (strain KUL10) TaxID=2161813 RepID=UPI000D782014|nr:hypothetical protein [Glaciecola sp. KUL10]GBL06342.1 hypothetical protein KUL10_36890 [Glaciecola sp. KUL10]